MPAVYKSRFVNFKAFKKTLKSFGRKIIIDASKPIYVRSAQRVLNKAKSNARRLPKATGKMARRIRFVGGANKNAGRGSLVKYTVYSSSVQDMVTTYGVPDKTLNGPEATQRSRTIRGKNHRLRAGFNYTKAKQKTAKGRVSKKLPIGKDGRPWAFGKRKAKPFMTDGQNFNSMINEMTEDIADRIFKEFDKAFSLAAK